MQILSLLGKKALSDRVYSADRLIYNYSSSKNRCTSFLDFPGSFFFVIFHYLLFFDPLDQQPSQNFDPLCFRTSFAPFLSLILFLFNVDPLVRIRVRLGGVQGRRVRGWRSREKNRLGSRTKNALNKGTIRWIVTSKGKSCPDEVIDLLGVGRISRSIDGRVLYLIRRHTFYIGTYCTSVYIE